jgi:predicted amidohydrolase
MRVRSNGALSIHWGQHVSGSALRVASIPFRPAPGDTAGSVAAIDRLAAQAADEHIRLLVFPELCMVASHDAQVLRRRELEALAEPLDGPSISAVVDIAARTGVAVGVGFIERADGGRFFNSYVVCMPDGLRHCHRKLYADGPEPFEQGDCFTVFDTPWGWRAAILTGADNELVENVRAAAVLGAAVLISPHRRCCTDDQTRLSRSLAARAQENGIFVVFCGVFDEGQETQAGCSMSFDPDGTMVFPGAETPGAMRFSDLDLTRVAHSEGQRGLKARRPELYGLLAESPANEPAPRHVGIASKRSIALAFAIVTRRRSAGW